MLPLSGKTTGFDIQNAYACAFAARIVYISPEQIADEVAKALELNSFRLVESPTIQGFVAAGETATLVTFQGSERDFDDWAGNMKAAFIPGPFGNGERVHRGFGKALNNVFDEVSANIEALANPGAPLFITGHSCGAAFATLLAARLLSTGRDFHSLYTFGSPRVGCRRFRDIYEHLDENRTFRIVNRHDIVARIPPRLMRYRHAAADDASFTISTDTLQSGAVFDYETKNSYDICIKTDDGNGGTYDKNFTVTVNDITIENNTPTDIALSSSTIDENETTGTAVGTMTTTDADGSDTHTYSLTCTTPAADDADDGDHQRHDDRHEGRSRA